MLLGGFALLGVVRCAAVAAESVRRARALAPVATALRNWSNAAATLGLVVEQRVILVRVQDALLVRWGGR